MAEESASRNSVVISSINRIVVLLHAGSLSQGSIVPLAFSDVHGTDVLEDHVKYHTDAGAKVIYDGPPSTAPRSELGEPVAWLIALTVDGKPRREVHLNNCIADYRVVDPKATVTPLYKAKA